MRNVTLTINMDRKCAECGKPGALASGICLSCVNKGMAGKVMKSQSGQQLMKRLSGIKASSKAEWKK